MTPLIQGFPRQRGDGPLSGCTGLTALPVPPPARGWSPPTIRTARLRGGSPASAGMVPRRYRRSCRATWFPRQRGDGPPAPPLRYRPQEVPPPARGWSPRWWRSQDRQGGSPASAGMVPLRGNGRTGRHWFPRQRGDGPMSRVIFGSLPPVPPPARGWSRLGEIAGRLPCGYPASAGMVPRTRESPAATPGFPRQRGDGPDGSRCRTRLRPVPPPARGWSVRDGPHEIVGVGSPASAGMVPVAQGCPRVSEGFPASAGMVPFFRAAHALNRGFPRQRGDGPRCQSLSQSAHRVPPPARYDPPHGRASPQSDVVVLDGGVFP